MGLVERVAAVVCVFDLDRVLLLGRLSDRFRFRDRFEFVSKQPIHGGCQEIAAGQPPHVGLFVLDRHHTRPMRVIVDPALCWRCGPLAASLGSPASLSRQQPQTKPTTAASSALAQLAHSSFWNFGHLTPQPTPNQHRHPNIYMPPRPAADEGPATRVVSNQQQKLQRQQRQLQRQQRAVAANPHVQPRAQASPTQEQQGGAMMNGSAGTSGAAGGAGRAAAGRRLQQQREEGGGRTAVADAIAARVQEGWRLLNDTCESVRSYACMV